MGSFGSWDQFFDGLICLMESVCLGPKLIPLSCNYKPLNWLYVEGITQKKKMKDKASCVMDWDNTPLFRKKSPVIKIYFPGNEFRIIFFFILVQLWVVMFLKVQ